MAEPMPEFWEDALEVIGASPIAYLATSWGDQPSVRPVTPSYQGITPYIATEVDSFKVRSIGRNPLVELLHWHTDFRHVSVRGRASLLDDLAKKEEMWDRFGYDLADFHGADGITTYGLMRIDPFRIEMTSLQRIAAGKPPLVWRQR